MKPITEFLVRMGLLVFIWTVWLWACITPLSTITNLSIIVGGLLLVYPFVWLGRKILDRRPTMEHVVWITTFVHYGLGFLLGLPIIRALITYQEWPDWSIPIPIEIGLILVVVTGFILLLTVANLAIKGFGAPFAIAISKKLAAEWMYAWTRNPMVLAGLAFLVSLGIWFQSVLFVLWVIFLFTPALLFFVKIYEERELEIRFGSSYLEYKSRTPMLIPRKPKE